MYVNSSSSGGTYIYRLPYGTPANELYSFNLSLNDRYSTLTGVNGIDGVKKAVVGDYQTLEAATSAADISEQLFSDASSGGGYAADLSQGVTFTVFTDDENTLQIMLKTEERPEPVPMYSLSPSSLYYDASDPDLYVYSSYDYSSRFYTYSLPFGTPANGLYSFHLRLSDLNNIRELGENGKDGVTKAVVGSYDTLEEADSAEDIRERLFSDSASGKGYTTDLSQGVTFTVFADNETVFHISLKAVELPDQVPNFSANYVSRLPSADLGGYIEYFLVNDEMDSYLQNGYQALFLLNYYRGAYSPIPDEQLTLNYTLTQGARAFSGLDKTGGTEFKSGETVFQFSNGEAMPFSVVSKGNQHSRNYWVTLITQYRGPKLYVHAANDPDNMVEVENADGGKEMRPQREIYLNENSTYHDILIANVGDENIEGLYATLSEDTSGVKLDDYWRINDIKTLRPFTTTDSRAPDGSYDYGKYQNLAKLRLVPINPEEAGLIQGTLTVGYEGEASGEEVRIDLSGIAGTLKITTGEDTDTLRDSKEVYKLADGVKFVPYSRKIMTNWVDAANSGSEVAYELGSGSCPPGVGIRTATGELYGVPTEAGEYYFTIRASVVYKSPVTGEETTLEDERQFVLTVAENDDEAVDNATDEGFQVVTSATAEHPYVTDAELIEHMITSYEGHQLVSEGAFEQFVALYIDGEELVRGEDYRARDGSTIIDSMDKSLENRGAGTHTIAMEFRDDGVGSETTYSTMHNTSRNYTTAIDSGSNSDYVEEPEPEEDIKDDVRSYMGSSGSSADSSSSETTSQTPAQSGGPLKLDYSVTDTEAAVKELSGAKALALNTMSNPSAELDLRDADPNVSVVILPKPVLQRLSEGLSSGDADVESLTLRLPELEVLIDGACLDYLNSQVDTGGLRVLMKSLRPDSEELTEHGAQVAANAVGGMRIEFSNNGNAITQFDGHRLELRIRYPLSEPADSRGYGVSFLPAAGEPIRYPYLYEDGYFTFHVSHCSDFAVLRDPASAYSDVPYSAWYSSYVDYLSREQIMSGMDVGEFAPEVGMTRAMFAQILYNLESGGEGTSRFSDVPEDAWYAPAVNWAAAIGIITGVDDDHFNPAREITREEISVILYRFAAFKQYLSAYSDTLNDYADASEISSWARDAMAWAVENQLFDGVGYARLDPQFGATRAQSAKLLTRFIENWIL